MKRSFDARTAVGYVLLAGLLLSASASVTSAAEWPSWRGPGHDGVSDESGLVSSWSKDGNHLIWRADFVGRSTPVVVDGRACVIGRTGEGITRQEVVACYDAGSGKLLWEDKFNVYHTTVPFNRVGWASLTADVETGNVYAHGVGGQLIGYAADGSIVWSHFLTEEYGRYSGYGGRTQTPLVVGDQLLISYVSSGWGAQAALRHRYYSFDKKTGDLLWVSTPGGMPADFNTQSTPVLAVIEGRQIIVSGNADGWVYALDAFTGAKIWGFHLSKRGLNSTVLVHGDRVFASHSEENLDTATMGRVVAIDATGEGDVTATHEVWRSDELSAGFPSPTIMKGRLYVIDNSANLYALDAATGATKWTHSLGTVGKGSPVIADGRLYVTEVNGHFHILKLKEDGVEILDEENLEVPGGRYAEIYGSPAIAYGRVYFASEEGLYCLGNADAPFKNTHGRPAVRAVSKGAATVLQVVPADAVVSPGERVEFRVRAVGIDGEVVLPGKASWTLDGLEGEVSEDGRFTADANATGQVGGVAVRIGELSARASVRVIRDLPWSNDFEAAEEGSSPATWIGAKGKFVVHDLDGNKVLRKAPRARGLNRSALYMGPPDLGNYTIEADVMGTRTGRRLSDVGLIASGYTLDLQGAHQKVQVRSWASVLRMAKDVEFAWEPDVWYRMKFSVDVKDGKALVRGKVWPRSKPEPDAWTISVDDPLPVTTGSPGLVSYSPVDGFFDNIQVTVNQ